MGNSVSEALKFYLFQLTDSRNIKNHRITCQPIYRHTDSGDPACTSRVHAHAYAYTWVSVHPCKSVRSISEQERPKKVNEAIKPVKNN